jgi:superfamily II DNA or RNA helicase
MARGRVRSLLVVCPRALMDQWRAELATKFGIACEVGCGAEFDRLRNHPCVITTYQTAAARIDQLTERGFDLVIMDEAHKLRSLTGPGGSSSMAESFHNFLMNRGATFVLMLTATPLQNRLWDIHSLMEILAAPQPNPLGSEDDFAARFIADGKNFARKMHPGARDEFRRRTGAYITRKRRADVGLMFPGRLVLDRKESPTLDEQVYLNECLDLAGALALPPMEQCTFIRSVLSSPAAAAGSLRKMRVNMPGEFFKKTDELIRRGEAFTVTTKTKALAGLLRSLRAENPAGWQAIVFTQRRATLRFLKRAMEAEGLGGDVCTFQGGDSDVNAKSIADFKADPPRKRILLATDAGAEGLNLQCCNTLINFDLPWNPMTVEQRIGRVQRLGQQKSHVVINNLVLAGTLEEKVVHRLLEKLELFRTAVGEMEEVLSLADESDGASFEMEVLGLIRKSLSRQDTDRDVELKKRSLDDARKKFEEMKEATEEALGRIAPEEDEVPAPQFDRRGPRRRPMEFARAALERRSKWVRPAGADRIDVQPLRGPALKFTFNAQDPELSAQAAVLDPSALRLMAPGTREFTELVDDWKAKAHVSAVSAVGRTRSAQDVVRNHLQERGDKVLNVTVKRRATRLCSELTAYAKATVYHDRHESLVDVAIRYGEDGVGFEHEAGLPSVNLPVETLGETWWKHAERAVRHELERPGSAFRGFAEFYEHRRVQQQLRMLRQVACRLKLEVTDHSTTERLLEKLAPRLGVEPTDFGPGDIEAACRALPELRPSYQAAVQDIDLKNLPKFEARPVGLRAILYERVTVAVDVIRAGESTPSTLMLDVVPLSGRVMPTPGK